MRSIFKAAAVLGSASMLNILIGLISSKITAVLLGPSGFGLAALYQSLLGLTVMCAGLGIPAAITRALARSLSRDPTGEAIALRHAGWAVVIVAALISMALIAGFSGSLTRNFFDSRTGAHWAIFIVPAVFFTMVSSVQIAIINAHHRVNDLARINVLSALFMLVPTVLIIWQYRENGVAPSIAVGTAISFLVGNYFYRKLDQPEAINQLDGPSVRQAVVELLRFGIPYMGSLIVGAGVLALLPILVLHNLGDEEVGLFRAASAIAVSYTGLLLAAMAQDYFPRVAKAPDDAASLNQVLNDQLRFVMLLAGPIVIALIGLVPLILPLLYTTEFSGAAGLLRWQLLGDLFKFCAWAMGYIIMVKLGSVRFFLTELVCGAVLLASCWTGMRLGGLPGLGMGFVATGIFALFVNGLVLYRGARIVWRRDNQLLFLLLVSSTALVVGLSLEVGDIATGIVSLTLSIVYGTYSILAIVREFGGWRMVLKRGR
mgnify:CR=1 FL=1